MKAFVIYESMYGNTRAVADAIADGLGSRADVTAVPVRRLFDPAPLRIDGADLVVVGAPTHTWSMPRTRTRKSAVDAAARPGVELTVEVGAGGPGLREWLAGLDRVPASRVAAFDTRMHAPCGLSGSAATPILKCLVRDGAQPAARPQGFFVSRDNVLDDGELERATAWGAELARMIVATT